MLSADTSQRKPLAVILGLETMQGLQAARILARRGVPVIAVVSNPNHHACRTNVCERLVLAGGENGTFNALRKLGPQLPRKAFLVPCQDGKVLTVSRHRHVLRQWYHFLLPDPDVVETLMDKTAFYEFAQRNGFPIPQTFFVRNRADAERAAGELRYPCILKPPFRNASWTARTKLKAFKARSKEEFLSLHAKCESWAETLIAQNHIGGSISDLYSCNCYFDINSKPLATFVARKLRQWPPETGQSSLGEECRDDIVLNESLRLFKNVHFRGLAYLEMKRDPSNGKYYIIEPNIGRPTGRSAIAEAGGVELLYTMYCDAVGLPLPENRVQRYTGVKWIHLRRDTQSAFQAWRSGQLSLREWARSVRGRKAYAIFSWRDPLPFVYDLLETGRSLLSAKERQSRGLGRGLSTAQALAEEVSASR
jgi:predicted ATP-grasp superfamily ATP-dependent carboligase